MIIRKNSSKTFIRPTSQNNRDDAKKKVSAGNGVVNNQNPGHYRNKTQVVKKNIITNIQNT